MVAVLEMEIAVLNLQGPSASKVRSNLFKLEKQGQRRRIACEDCELEYWALINII
jgi:hypothetical protein